MGSMDALALARRIGPITAERQTRLSDAARTIHQAILRHFLGTGAGPTTERIGDLAVSLGLLVDETIAELRANDLVRIADGVVALAYPFSGTPTRHRVRSESGRAVYATCAVDALGIAYLTGLDVFITSADPRSGEPVRVVRSGHKWIWHPDEAVVAVPSAVRTNAGARGICPYSPFFADRDSAGAYVASRLDGQILDHKTAIDAGRIGFGSLLDPA